MAQGDTVIETAGAKAQSTIEGVRASGTEAVDAYRDVANTMGDALDEALKTRPYATLAIAAGIGFLFGAAWSR